MLNKNNATDKKLILSDKTKIRLGTIYPPPYSAKQKAVVEMVEKGMDLNRAIQIAGYSQSNISTTRNKLEKYFLSHPVMLRKGKKIFHKLADDFLSDKGNVKDSTALRLVELQQNRINPEIKLQHNLDTQVTFCRIDLREIRVNAEVGEDMQKAIDNAVENVECLPPDDLTQNGQEKAFKNNEL